MGTSSEKAEINAEERKNAKKKLSHSEFHKIPDSLDINLENIANKNMLELHNKFRRIHHADNLINNNDLNIKAKKYAQMLLEQNSHIKENNLYNNKILGENIYISSKEESEENIINLWYNEKSNYNYELNNFQRGTNHFTQIVWKSTKQVGFGSFKSSNKFCYVALYYPAGNIFGKFGENVLNDCL